MLTLAFLSVALGTIPSVLLLLNLLRYRRAPRPSGRPFVSVLIPARNEETNIGHCLQSVLANRAVDMEVLVLDDHSSDRTAEIVIDIASRDSRVQLIHSAPLPRDWCGKQFACHQLGARASGPYLCFIDADVRLSPDALNRSVRFLEKSGAGLVSGVPRQLAETFAESMLIPLIHFILLAYLPFGMMRRSLRPAFGAGCGQLFLARRESYLKAGGHGAVKNSGHDGLQLPRRFRSCGLRTDLFDPTDLAICRMYSGKHEVWAGFAKNAVEGVASPGLIVPFTVLFLFGQILPPALAFLSFIYNLGQTAQWTFATVAIVNFGARVACAWRFKQSIVSALLHPLALLAFLAIQWRAWHLNRRGRSFLWKGRPQPRIAS